MQAISSATELLRSGNFQDAKEILSYSLKTDPGNLVIQELLAYALAGLGQKQEAINILSIVTQSDDCSLGALYEYGSTLLANNLPYDAIEPLERAYKMSPPIFEVTHDLGTAYALVGRRKEAIAKYVLAAKLFDGSSELFYNIGRLYDEEFDFLKANSFYLKALAINPFFYEAQANFGLNLCRSGRHLEGIPLLKEVLQVGKNFDFLYGDMVHAKMQMCIWDNLAEEMGAIVEAVKHGHKVVSPFVLLGLIDDPLLHQKASKIYADSKFNFQFNKPVFQNHKGQKIRVGYFSYDFRNHAVTNLTTELFELHDRNKFEIYAFSSSFDNNDEPKQRLKKAFHEFIDISKISDEEAATLSRQKGIDIAVDLGGYTENSRIGIFGRRAAPIQVSYLGYLGTLGGSNIDYLLADCEVIPPQYEQFFNEKIAYLPNCFQINDRQRAISDHKYTRTDFGLPNKGFIFCSFNNSYKITPNVFSSWCRILERVEGSILWLYERYKGLGGILREEAKIRGIEPERLIFSGVLPGPEYLARYRLADLFLDTFPYNAGTTASDALMVGLPVLTRSGKSFPSRMAGSILKALHVPELITYKDEEYEDIAVELATNRSRLELIRSKLKANRKSAPLFDSPRTTKNIERAYQEMYKNYLEGKVPENIYLSD